jgi:hypothetical protein
MVRYITGVVAAVVALAALAVAQAPAPGPDALLQPTWNLTTDFAAPESAYHHAASNAVFISSINGQILEKDGNGYISRLRPDGTMVAAKWVTGLNAPKGMRSVGGTLWVSDIDEVVSIDIESARITARVKVDGAQFLNDLATSPDGTVYVSDSALSRIYAVKDGRSFVFVEGATVVEQPNGLLVDGGRLILGTIGPAPTGPGPGGRGSAPASAPTPPVARGGGAPTSPTSPAPQRPGGHLFAFDFATKARTQLTTQPVGGIDGIEPDGRGGLLVTDVIGSRLLHVSAAGEVRVLGRFALAGADFCYIASSRTAIVPFLFGNSVAGFDLTAALR